MTITWKIEQLDRQASDGLVTTAHWRATAVDGDHSASVYGSVGLERGNNFTPFDQLTEQTVMGWVKDKLEVSEIETNLTAQINAQKTPATLNGLPW